MRTSMQIYKYDLKNKAIKCKALYFKYSIYFFIWAPRAFLHLEISYKCIKIRTVTVTSFYLKWWLNIMIYYIYYNYVITHIIFTTLYLIFSNLLLLKITRMINSMSYWTCYFKHFLKREILRLILWWKRWKRDTRSFEEHIYQCYQFCVDQVAKMILMEYDFLAR